MLKDDLTLNTNFTTSNISKLLKLRMLEINNITFDEFVDFTNNKELVSLTINNSKINSLK